jgi:outer membrane protein
MNQKLRLHRTRKPLYDNEKISLLPMKILYTFLMICFGSFALADNAPSETTGQQLTLKEALDAAYGMSFLTSYQYDVKGSYEALSAAKREFFPKVGLSSSYTADFNHTHKKTNAYSQNSVPGSVTYNDQVHSARNSITLSQNIFAGGKTVAGVRGQKHGVEKALAGYAKQESNFLFQVIKAYSDLVLKQESYDVYVANQKVLEEQYRVAKSTNELGANTISDVAQTEAKLAKVKAAVTFAKAEVENAKANLEQYTGIPDPGKLAPLFLPTILPKSREEAIHQAFEHSNELKAAESEALQAKEAVVQARSDLLPSIDVSATGSRNFQSNWSNSFSKSATSTFEAAATLSVPLDFRGGTQAGVRKYKYDAAKKRIDIVNTKRMLTATIVARWETMEAKRKNISETEEQVKAAKIAYDSMKEEFSAGLKTTLHLLSAEQEYFSAQLQLLGAKQEYLVAAYDLLRDIGTLTPQFLELSARAFNPKDFENVPIWGTSIKE